jgi:hypothetical protein
LRGFGSELFYPQGKYGKNREEEKEEERKIF